MLRKKGKKLQGTGPSQNKSEAEGHNFKKIRERELCNILSCSHYRGG